ncbi:MAG: hypothetical protein EOO44_19005 [Flavobacterium sp.]|nr:MAG: hypothetical protein EOO44_19005 [Flavobacterium sp.]
MKDTLLQYLNELVIEFEANKSLILNDPKLSHCFKIGTYPVEGTKRDSKSYSTIKGFVFDKPILQNVLCVHIKDFSATKKIYDLISINNMWHMKYESYEICVKSQPNLVSSIVAGFLVRVFEINNNQFVITNNSFKFAFDELIDFLGKDSVEFDVLLSLKGVSGEIPVVKLNDEISILKADFQIAKYYGALFNGDDYFLDIEMFEGDYVMQIHFNVPKEYFNFKTTNVNRLIMDRVNKWKILPVLALPSLLQAENQIYRSRDWAIINYTTSGTISNQRGSLRHNNHHTLTNSSIEKLRSVALILQKVNLNELHKKVVYSLERLTKSKRSNSVDDRVVELSIALEYLINTSNSDVTLQLCLKLIKLTVENNIDESLYTSLKKFYGLRSYIVHGNKKVEASEVNISYVRIAEDMIQNGILRFMELMPKYDYDSIDVALTKSLHISKTVMEILETQNITKVN